MHQKHFRTFLEALRSPNNQNTINAITEGYNALIESQTDNKHLVVVDIQPDYQNSFSFDIQDFIQFINNAYGTMSNLTFLFNGPDLGYPDENEYKMWLLENGLNENIIYQATFYDKGYAFFRYCMDSDIEEEQIVNLVKFMMDKDINDSRDLNDKNLWDEFQSIYGSEDIRDLMEISGDCISIPDLMDEMSNYSNVVLTGGGIYECLKEVEIALQVLDKPYSILNEFTY